MPFINTYKKGSRTTVNEESSRTTVNLEGSRPALNHKGSRTTVNEENSRKTVNEEGSRPALNHKGSRTTVNEEGSRSFGVSPVPTDSFLICSFNANKKMEPISLHTWINVLRRVPWSILLLLDLLVDAKKYLLMEMRFHGRLSVKME